MNLANLAGYDLGTHEHSLDVDDAILYALAVGASTEHLDLIWERDLRVLPTQATAIGLWAVERAGDLGFYDRTKSLHVGQTLRMKEPLSPGPVSMSATVGDVYDKGRMTILIIEVVARQFEASYTIFLPGVGNWGGSPPPKPAQEAEREFVWQNTVAIAPTAAALYRLTGDKHPIHIDAETAIEMGVDSPILHGLATLGMVAHAAAVSTGAHPADLRYLDVRLSAPVYPGSTLNVVGTEPTPDEAGKLLVRATADEIVTLTGVLDLGRAKAQ